MVIKYANVALLAGQSSGTESNTEKQAFKPLLMHPTNRFVTHFCSRLVRSKVGKHTGAEKG